VPSHSFRAGRGGETAALGLETAGAGVDEVARRESSQLGVESSAEQIIHTRCGGAPCEIHELALYRLGSRTALENKMDLCLHVLTVDYVFRHCVHVHLEVCLDYRVYSQSRAVGCAVEFDAMGLHLLLGGTPAEVECDGLGGGSGARGSHDVDGRLCVLVAVWIGVAPLGSALQVRPVSTAPVLTRVLLLHLQAEEDQHRYGSQNSQYCTEIKQIVVILFMFVFVIHLYFVQRNIIVMFGIIF